MTELDPERARDKRLDNAISVQLRRQIKIIDNLREEMERLQSIFLRIANKSPSGMQPIEYVNWVKQQAKIGLGGR